MVFPPSPTLRRSLLFEPIFPRPCLPKPLLIVRSFRMIGMNPILLAISIGILGLCPITYIPKSLARLKLFQCIVCSKRARPPERIHALAMLFLFSLALMHIYYLLILKTYVRIQPPIQWKGGMLQELFKGKGSSSVCSNFRDVMLACVDGKMLLSTLEISYYPEPIVFPSILSLEVVLMEATPLLHIFMSGWLTKLVGLPIGLVQTSSSRSSVPLPVYSVALYSTLRLVMKCGSENYIAMGLALMISTA